MSKHPIPDWLRSQFSRIEDEVRKLGPCGVFTQMRTVTQTYFEQQAAAPQPPALGGEPITRYDMDQTACAEPCADGVWVKFEDLVPLQAEIENLKLECDAWKNTAESFEDFYRKTEVELDQLKAQCDELEALLREVAALDPRGEFMGWQLDGRIDAALSKPAGSEQV